MAHRRRRPVPRCAAGGGAVRLAVGTGGGGAAVSGTGGAAPGSATSRAGLRVRGAPAVRSRQGAVPGVLWAAVGRHPRARTPGFSRRPQDVLVELAGLLGPLLS